jgi:hypothetical protein
MPKSNVTAVVRHFSYPYGKWSRRMRDLVEGSATSGRGGGITLD